MKTVSLRPVLWIGGVVALVASAVMTTATLKALREGADRLAGKCALLDELQQLGESHADYAAARRAFEALDARSSANFEQAVQEALARRKPEDVRRDRENLSPGWAVERVEIYLTELPFEELAPLLQQAESLRPPWRLTRCVLSGSPRAAGTGRATLQFERICRE